VHSINMPIHSSSNYLNHPTLIKLAKVSPLLKFCKFRTFFYEYIIQHSLKSGGTKDHFRRVKVPGTTSY
jgi:hypothetical protein